jgi:beta-lactamase class A
VQTSEALRAGVVRIADALPGRLGVAVDLLDTGDRVEHHAHDLFYAASVIKIPIMVEVFRRIDAGEISPDEPLPVVAGEVTGGSGVLQFLHVGLDLTVHDALELMIAVSDNTATNLLLRHIGGAEAVNSCMDRLGLSETRSGGPIRQPNPAVRSLSTYSRTTPAEMAQLLTGIARDEVVSLAACAEMRRILAHQLYDTMLPRYLPLTGDTTITVAHKTGSIGQVRNDAGILTVDTPGGTRTAVVSAFTDELQDDDLWTPENIGARAVAEVGRLVYDALTAQ